MSGRWWKRAERSGAAKRRRASTRRKGAGARGGDARRRNRARRRASAAPAAAKVAGPLDGGVLASTATLTGIGIVMVYCTTAPLAIGNALPPHFLRHLAAVAGGLVCIAAALRVPMTLWRRLALPLWALGVGLLAFTCVAGIEVNGARRWLAIPGLELRLQAAGCFHDRGDRIPFASTYYEEGDDRDGARDQLARGPVAKEAPLSSQRGSELVALAFVDRARIRPPAHHGRGANDNQDDDRD